MTDNEEWGPWIDHDGKGQPISDGTIYQAELEGKTERWRNSGIILSMSGNRVIIINVAKGQKSWDWSNFNTICFEGSVGRIPKVIRYRVKKPKGLTMLEELLQNLPVPTKIEERV